MTKFIRAHEKLITRILEIIPGLVSWNIILLPYWGVFFIPTFVAYFILLFNIYWFYQSFELATAAIISHFRIQATITYDWLTDIKNFPDYKKVIHVIIIPTYKEPLYILERTLNSIANQDFPLKQIIPVIAMEKKEDETDRAMKMKVLKEKFGKKFGDLFFTVHTLINGEIAGKSSNERYAAIWVKNKLVKELKKDINYITITSSDADHTFHPKHFSVLTFKFLDNPDRFNHFWQPAVLFYNNIWEVPALTRVPNTFGSIWNLSQLSRRDKLINGQNYSLSLKLLDDAGYWDPDKIPEDWGIFFKAYFKRGGNVEVEPLYIPLYADAPKSPTLIKTLKNQYDQFKRWAWGVSDVPWIIKNYFLVDKVPLIDKTMRLLNVIKSHFLWPVNWFLITIGLTLPTLLNPAFGRTTLGYTVPKLSSFVLTVGLVFLLIMFVIDYFYKPKRPATFPLWRALLVPFEFILMPITGFIFGALPGLDAHTRLMLGKYMEYKVTEKV